MIMMSTEGAVFSMESASALQRIHTDGWERWLFQS